MYILLNLVVGDLVMVASVSGWSRLLGVNLLRFLVFRTLSDCVAFVVAIFFGKILVFAIAIASFFRISAVHRIYFRYF